MPYDQALCDHDAIETLACETSAAPESPVSTAQIVARLNALSRAAREHFRADDQRIR